MYVSWFDCRNNCGKVDIIVMGSFVACSSIVKTSRRCGIVTGKNPALNRSDKETLRAIFLIRTSRHISIYMIALDILGALVRKVKVCISYSCVLVFFGGGQVLSVLS